jgi:hypothetical protein
VIESSIGWTRNGIGFSVTWAERLPKDQRTPMRQERYRVRLFATDGLALEAVMNLLKGEVPQGGEVVL